MLDIEDCLREILAIPGALDALAVEDIGGAAIATGRGAGGFDAQATAQGLCRAFHATLDALGPASPHGTVRVEDAIVTADQGLHLVRPLDTPLTGPVLLYVRLDRDRANLALARHRLRELSGRLITT
ncbi:hypothetical protein Sru01_33850 [Sphaerisporangium rufum]|uniref:Uncharacterized protein n=1 Tax=Sphaerisporangium rufum TaxID=1381558 RepID=A0A919V207_9ACTN|nr:roadblock/LC7 domain-containing protein [Sphaerisporangium rufum]GII78403.1 hypothetical protein Sru01_33850 [Sphaerisporangium rufum]